MLLHAIIRRSKRTVERGRNILGSSKKDGGYISFLRIFTRLSLPLRYRESGLFKGEESTVEKKEKETWEEGEKQDFKK